MRCRVHLTNFVGSCLLACSLASSWRLKKRVEQQTPKPPRSTTLIRKLALRSLSAIAVLPLALRGPAMHPLLAAISGYKYRVMQHTCKVIWVNAHAGDRSTDPRGVTTMVVIEYKIRGRCRRDNMMKSRAESSAFPTCTLIHNAKIAFPVLSMYANPPTNPSLQGIRHNAIF
jgi:hypothetical protein